jgi:hypothetical protein
MRLTTARLRDNMDLVVLAIAVGFFGLSWAVIQLLDRL